MDIIDATLKAIPLLAILCIIAGILTPEHWVCIFGIVLILLLYSLKRIG